MAEIPETLQTIEKYCEEIKGKQQTIMKYCEEIKGKQQTIEKYCEEIIALSYDVYLKSVAVAETRNLMVELSRQFYTLGWFVGTGGSISIKIHDDILPRAHQLIVMSPSGVQKERMIAEDTYVLSPYGSVILSPTSKPHPHTPPKYTDCAPLFLKVYEICNAGAVIHSHGTEACLVTMIDRDAKEFRIKNMEMIKGIEGHGYNDDVVVPIIENTQHEGDLLVPFTQAIRAYPKTKAVLVRNHGVFIWGDSWIRAKTQAECYHYLFDAAIKLRQLGLNWPTSKELPNGNVCKFKC